MVGSGPAGIAAAMAIHQQGGKALLLDKKSFPRPKACAGMMTPLALAHAPFPLIPAICAVSLQLHWKAQEKTQTFLEKNVLSHRIELDHFMHKEAVRSGIAFRQDSPQKIRIYPDKIQIMTESHLLLEGRTLVAADGANSYIRRLLRIPAAGEAFALEVDTPLLPPLETNPALFDYDAIAQGYAWWFPKGNTSNFGIGVFNKSDANLKEGLRQFMAVHSATLAHAGKIRGALIGCYGKGTYLGRERVLFCGDAAGLADPWTGEGISYAFLSGKLAGDAIMHKTTTPAADYALRMVPTLALLQQRLQQAGWKER